MAEELPLIRKITEVGETPFQFIEKTETILQGWDTTIKRSVFLFKTNSGRWGYYDKKHKKMVEVTQWNEKEAFLGDHYVKMDIYHRIRVIFPWPVRYNAWDAKNRREYPAETQDAILIVTDKNYNQILDAMGGDKQKIMSFVFTEKKVGKRDVKYIDNVAVVDPKDLASYGPAN